MSLLKPCPNDGAEPEWNCIGPMCDQLECPACGRSTHSYYDGREFAVQDWNEGTRLLNYGKKPRPIYNKTVHLKRSEWTKCMHCDGVGQFLMPGNLHESEGWVPCPHCHKGIVTTKTVPVYRIKARSVKI